MLEKFAIIAPIALLLSPAGGDEGWRAPETAIPVPVQHQVRIEQRVVLRISPRSASARQNLLAELPRQLPVQEYEERKIGKCLPVKSIVAVQTGSGNQLLLFTRDQRIISARLEKACRARDFYSGFYVEQNKDGMLCVERDKLQSRAGANCEISRIRQLVVDED
ncbi:MAG: hypothetical protein A3J40_07045 [Erythrobacter sp. RIFCSPHIGHO2_12_FULL_63_10]|nr:MAG: hypothetical protein A3J40_07045 [Erythrobacter sp. RIFCSPHIGHO2_12_FULL_63_10]